MLIYSFSCEFLWHRAEKSAIDGELDV